MVSDHNTDIDVIFTSSNRSIFIIGECKRAEPSKSNWCFVKAPYSGRNISNNELFFDETIQFEDKKNFRKCHTTTDSKESYSLYFEIKADQQKGDGLGNNQNRIDSAISQVLRSTSGFMNFILSTNKEIIKSNQPTYFISVIFTTAKLFTSEIDISQGDIETGLIDNSLININEVPCLWINHNRSPILSPNIPLDVEKSMFGDLSYYLQQEFTRSIAIVNPSGMKNFLSWDWESWIS